MADPEITALRELLAQRPRPPAIADRRVSFDAFAKVFPTAGDIAVERVSANGVEAEWTAAPGADHARVVLYVHGGGYVIGSLDSHRHLVSEAGRAATEADDPFATFSEWSNEAKGVWQPLTAS